MIKKSFYLFLFLTSMVGFYFLNTLSFFNPAQELVLFLNNLSSNFDLILDSESKKQTNIVSSELSLAEVKLKEENTKFIKENLELQDDVTSNSYKTLTSIAIKMNERYFLNDYKSVTILLSDMRRIIRDSGLSTDEKIRLYKRIRSLEELVLSVSNSNKKIMELNKKRKTDVNKNILSNSIQQLRNSIDTKKSKINEQMSYKTYPVILCFILLITGLIGMLYEYSKIKINNKKESQELIASINSIIDGADPEILIRLKRLAFYEDIKISLFESLKIFSNQVLFFKEQMNNLSVPVFLNSHEGTYSNIAMNRLCLELDIDISNVGSIFFFNNCFYIKKEANTSFMLLPIEHSLIKNFIDQEIFKAVSFDDLEMMPEHIKTLYLKNKEIEASNLEIDKKKELAQTRLKSVMDMARQQKQDYSLKLSVLNQVLQEGRSILDNGLLLSASIKNLGKKVVLVHQFVNESLSLSSRIGEAKKATVDVLNNFPELSESIYSLSIWIYQIINEKKLGIVSNFSEEDAKKAEYRIERMKLLVDDIDVALNRFLSMHQNFNMDELYDLLEELSIAYKTVFDNADRVNSGLEDLSISDANFPVRELEV